MRIHTIDLEFQGAPHVIAAFVIEAPGGPVLIEPGPGSTLKTLLRKMAELEIDPAAVQDVLVTHIHLDHAGSAGWWARKGARVWVHPIGAPHLIDPTKLLASATRIYGDRMETLWGELLAAPAARVNPVEHGAEIEAGGLRIDVVETPGHAYHHHVYKIGEIAFAGDAAGILLPGNRWIDLPAPPPEFHLEHWEATLERLRGLGLRTLYRTHFGPTSNVQAELDQFEEVLHQSVEWIGQMVDRGLERQSMIDEFTARMRGWAESTGTEPQDAIAYELANPREMSIDGIGRYWKKREGG